MEYKEAIGGAGVREQKGLSRTPDLVRLVGVVSDEGQTQ